MRPLFLLLMILATAMSPLFAQKQLPASIKPYAVHWGYSTKQMFKAAGYDVPGPNAEYDLVPTIKTRSDVPQLDSTVTYAVYDIINNDSIPILKNVYAYPQPGTEVITEYYFDIDHWIPLSRTTLISDELGRMIETLATVYDEETDSFLPDSRILLYPYKDNLIEVDSFFVSGWSVELDDWSNLLSVWNTFDGADRLRESLSSLALFDVPVVFLDRHFYNNDNELTGIETFNIDGEEMYPASRETYTYADHLLIEKQKALSDGGNGFIPDSKTEYNYTATRKEELVKTFVVDAEGINWVLDHVLGYVYDAEERVTMKEEVTSTDIGGWKRKLTTTAYYQDEYPDFISTYNFDVLEDDWILDERTFYFYNQTTAYEPVEPVQIKTLEMWPNPASDEVQFELTGETDLTVYNAAGQLIKNYHLADGREALDVSTLPAGEYYLSGQTSDGYYTGKLIVQKF